MKQAVRISIISTTLVLLAGCKKRPDDYEPRPVTELAGRFKTINAHEHIRSRKDAPKLLKVMDNLSIARTVIAAGSKKTTHHIKYGFIGYDDNNQEMLEIAKLWPERFVPFVTLNPRDEDNVERLAKWVAKGAKGLKLYSGHGMFYDLPLDHPNMIPVYKWAAEHKLPVLWHVNNSRQSYYAEFKSALDQAPGMITIAPHHCMSTTKPEQVRELFKRYPNLYTDISHGTPQFMADALRRISRTPGTFRALYEEFSDRFMWGSDTVVTGHPRKTAAWIERMSGMYFGLLGEKRFTIYTFDKEYLPTGSQELDGLDLPVELQRKILQTNAERILGLKPL